jgi:hypothetical protein
MTTKYRSKVNYKQIMDGDKQGYNLGLDGALFVTQEASPRVFQAPSIGTQGKSAGAVSASVDISAAPSPATLKVQAGSPTGLGAVVTASVVTAGLSTGLLIAAALESSINSALLADGQDSRVWVEYLSAGPDQYVVHSQSTGLTSSIVITPGTTNDLAVALKLGTANAGVETAGVDDQDFLLYTSGGPTFSQPIESNTHRSGRYHSGIIKKKKIADFKFGTFVNMAGAAGSSIDKAVMLLWRQLLGSETVVASTKIQYRQSLPNFYFSLVRVSTIFAEYYTGAYIQENVVTFPGAGPATCEWMGKASKRLIASLGQVNGAVVSSANVVLDAGHVLGYDLGVPVMVVDADGRTILAGADGSLTVTTLTPLSEQLTLSSPVSVVDDGYIVPWNPGAMQQTGRDAITTDLEGSIKLRAAGSRIDTTNVVLSFKNNHNDLNGYFGRDANSGFVAGNRLMIDLSVTFDLTTQETMRELVQTSAFGGFSPEVILGAATARHLRVTAPNWIVSVPPIAVPENGPTPVTLTGNFYQSQPGAADPVLVEFL